MMKRSLFMTTEEKMAANKQFRQGHSWRGMPVYAFVVSIPPIDYDYWAPDALAELLLESGLVRGRVWAVQDGTDYQSRRGLAFFDPSYPPIEDDLPLTGHPTHEVRVTLEEVLHGAGKQSA